MLEADQLSPQRAALLPKASAAPWRLLGFLSAAQHGCLSCSRKTLGAQTSLSDREQLSFVMGRCEDLDRKLDRLATDALAALSAAGIATPVEGYREAPWCLSGDIQKLARERDGAVLEFIREAVTSGLFWEGRARRADGQTQLIRALLVTVATQGVPGVVRAHMPCLRFVTVLMGRRKRRLNQDADYHRSEYVEKPGRIDLAWLLPMRQSIGEGQCLRFGKTPVGPLDLWREDVCRLRVAIDSWLETGRINEALVMAP